MRESALDNLAKPLVIWRESLNRVVYRAKPCDVASRKGDRAYFQICNDRPFSYRLVQPENFAQKLCFHAGIARDCASVRKNDALISFGEINTGEDFRIDHDVLRLLFGDPIDERIERNFVHGDLFSVVTAAMMLFR